AGRFRQRLLEVYAIVGRHFRRQHRDVVVDQRLDDNRTGLVESLVQGRKEVFGALDRESFAYQRLFRLGEIDRLQLAAELGVTEEHHLFPGNLVEHVVLDHQQLQRDPVAHRGGELAELHGETAIADHGTDLPAGVGDAGSYGIGEAAG